MRILIVGCGYVGRRLAELLVEDSDHEVFALSRSGAANVTRVTDIALDLVDGDLSKLPRSLDRIFYCAAPDDASVDAYTKIYGHGLQRFLNLMERTGAYGSRLLLTSSTSVYGQSLGEVVTEDTPTDPTSPTARTIAQGESLLRPGDTSVRFGGIYGPGRVSFIRAVQSGALVVNPASSAYTNRIHRDDAARVLKFCSGLEHPPSVFNGVDTESATRATVAQWLADRLGVAIKTIDDTEESHFLRGNKRVSSQRLLSYGYQFIYPTFREGYATLLPETSAVAPSLP
ncbi:MAG: NAD-dependent epimerase/dehydratase family protein [Deltaproteobacteria bacterium]|nr:NAD-dependent epimerase/dehydratase family protein [Deltaproteobacteria bacterium]